MRSSAVYFVAAVVEFYDLHGSGPAYGEEFSAWREAHPRMPADAGAENWIAEQFGNFVLRRTEDDSKWRRAPWDHGLR